MTRFFGAAVGNIGVRKFSLTGLFSERLQVVFADEKVARVNGHTH